MSQEGICHDDLLGTQHYAQAPAFQGLQLPTGNLSHQYILDLSGGLPYQDTLGITADVLGIPMDSLGIFMDIIGITKDLLGIMTNVPSIKLDLLGVILDASCPPIHHLLY